MTIDQRVYNIRKGGHTNMLSMLLEGVGRVDHFEFLSCFSSCIKEDSFSSSGYSSVSFIRLEKE
jgi:hypothetical protein